MTTIYLASDHAGVDLKNILIDHIQKLGFHADDLGPVSKESCDYPDYAQKLCQKVEDNEESFGILICGTGIGMSMAANRFPKIRAALCCFEFQAQATREHNNANVLCLGARVTGEEIAKKITEIFLETEFSGGRHQKRLDKFSK